MNLTHHDRTQLLRALLAAGILLLTAGVSKIASPAFLSADGAARLLGIAMGALVVMYANQAPKILAPLASRCSAAHTQALRRFTGWALVLGGLGYMAAWLLAPVDQAATLALALLGTAFALVLLRLLHAIVH
ncbi:hypothetical protein [Massilia sp. PWRC2]|uniref:hypothetical protein n=1 Tax=Massilia sp. PWRC2 TaxID=2804626 RepID=UPI003CEACB02